MPEPRRFGPARFKLNFKRYSTDSGDGLGFMSLDDARQKLRDLA
jgi:hypothetical protein